MIVGTGGHRRQPATEHQQQVAVLHREVARPRTADAAHRADRERVARAVDIHGRGSVGHRDLPAVDQQLQLRSSLGGTHATSQEQDRTLRGQQRLGQEMQIVRGRRRRRCCVGHVTLQGLGLHPHVLDVQRHIDPHRALASGGGEVERLVDLVGDFLGVRQHHGIFREALDGLHDVRLLLSEGAQRDTRVARRLPQPVLPRQHHQGNVILPGAQQPGDRVGRAATRRHEAGAEPAGMLGVGHG